jgi:hypothetical protein
LILENNKIKLNNLKVLSNSLKDNQTITSLSLDYNLLNDECFSCLFSYLKFNSVLKKLSLKRNKFSEVEDYLNDYFIHNQCLDEIYLDGRIN